MGVVITIEDYQREKLQQLEEKNRKDYADFVDLLKYFVQTQVPKFDTLRVDCSSEGYTITDEKGKEIDRSYINYYLEEMLLEEVSLDDILISLLITIAPRKIFIRGNYINNNNIRLIADIFKERVVFA